MVAVAVRCGDFVTHCSQLLWLQMKLPFNQVVRDYLTCALGVIVVEAMAASDRRERPSFSLCVTSSMKGT